MSRQWCGSLVAAGLLTALVPPVQAAESMTPDDFRVYCGYLEAQQDETMAKLSTKARDAKIAKMAKVNPKKLKQMVKLGESWGSSCEAITKQVEKDILQALQDTRLKSRVEFVEVSGEQWDQMVVRIRWKGDEDRYLEEEAATAALVTLERFPMVHTMACAAYNPHKPDESLFEGIISNSRMGNIQKDRIETFADTRYIKLFDNKKFAKPRP
ncbi:MAG: hypothetical protein ABIJ09_01175 [Pseudomonadota bacterium]